MGNSLGLGKVYDVSFSTAVPAGQDLKASLDTQTVALINKLCLGDEFLFRSFT